MESNGLISLLNQSAQDLNLNLLENQKELIEFDYLSRLSELSISSLESEPDRLQQLGDQLDSELSLLCFREFRTFLLVEEANQSIHQTFDQLHQSIQNLISISTQLSHQIQDVHRFLQPILNHRQELKTILKHLNPIEDLLDLPQLISTCVNAKLWNEAIELGLRVQRLQPISSSRNNEDQNQILAQLQLEVNQALRSLRDLIINTLRDRSLKLPTAVRSIAILQRISTSFSTSSIQAFDQCQLSMKFLWSRWQSLTDQLHQLQLSTGFSIIQSQSKSMALHHHTHDTFSDSNLQINDERLKFMRRWIDTWRELVGDTLLIYSEIFLIQPSRSSLASNHSINLIHQTSTPFFNPQIGFNFFGTQSIQILIQTLKHQLKLFISTSTLSSLLTQLNYCAIAFQKWGLDFSSLLRPLFLQRLQSIIQLRLDLGLDQFSTELNSFLSTPTPHTASFNQARRRSLRPISSLTLQHHLIAPDALSRVLDLKPTLDSPTPSLQTLNLFPPLARLVNSQFITFNELRLLPFSSSYPLISSHHLKTLSSATHQLQKLTHHFTLSSSQASNQIDETREVIIRVISIWFKLVLPTLENSLRVELFRDLMIKQPSLEFNQLLESVQSLFESLTEPHQPKSDSLQVSSTSPIQHLKGTPTLSSGDEEALDVQHRETFNQSSHETQAVIPEDDDEELPTSGLDDQETQLQSDSQTLLRVRVDSPQTTS